jgi:hypothetical protein
MEAGTVSVDTFTVEEPGAVACQKMSAMGYSTFITVNAHTHFQNKIPSSAFLQIFHSSFSSGRMFVPF